MTTARSETHRSSVNEAPTRHPAISSRGGAWSSRRADRRARWGKA